MGIQPWDPEKTIGPDGFHVYWVCDRQQFFEPFKSFSIYETELAVLQH